MFTRDIPLDTLAISRLIDVSKEHVQGFFTRFAYTFIASLRANKIRSEIVSVKSGCEPHAYRNAASIDFEIIKFLICEQTLKVVGRSRVREESVVLHENPDAKLLT